MYRVKVQVPRRGDQGFGAGLVHFRVAEQSDVKEADGNLIIFGCAFDWESKRDGQTVRRGHQVARVTVIPAGQWFRLDITEVAPSDNSY